MTNQHYLCRLDFRSGDASPRYRVMGEMTDDSDVDFKVAIEPLTDMRKLPFCQDCFGELGWAELIYGSGARQ